MGDSTTQAHFVPELTADEKAFAGLAHALMMSTWWVAPLIIYFMKKESRFVRFHAMQVLLWQLIYSESDARAVGSVPGDRKLGDANRRILSGRQDRRTGCRLRSKRAIKK